MTYAKTKSRYIHTEISTSNKLELVILCYDKSIQFLKQAKDYLLKKEYELKSEKLAKVIDIIGELKCSLNFDHGGDLAKNLDAIYTYLTNRLVEGDLNKDSVVFDEAVNILEELREAWQGISRVEDGVVINSENSINNRNLQQISA